MSKYILGASIGNCVHVAGLYHFLQIAEKEGYEIIFMGPAVPIEKIICEIERYKPDIVALSYRLTSNNVVSLLDEFISFYNKLSYKPKLVFGGTKPVADIARSYNIFSFVSDGFDDINDSLRFLRGKQTENTSECYGRNVIERINKSYPYPLIRHHFGTPSLEETIAGISEIAKSKVLDIISIGPDQNAQQFFFNQEKMKPEFNGAGGVPVRTEEDFIAMKNASKYGNYPLMRCYSGTSDVFKYADMLIKTINNAWSAIPLFWYNELDGRGDRPIEISIKEAQELIKWHAQNNIPVEINEPHHWGLRDAHDVIPVVMAYISAYNAKKLGVKHYISQYMFNNPSGISFSMDFARILAMKEMVDSLSDDNFNIYTETRAGLPLFNADPYIAKGQLAASTFLQMCLKPHIIHVVGYCEADHAATAKEVIESCRIVKGVIRHTLNDEFNIDTSRNILLRKENLISEAKVLLNYILDKYSYDEDPLTNPEILADLVKKGYIDAVHIIKGGKFKGNLTTIFKDGACVAVDKNTGDILDELSRLSKLDK